LLHLGSAALLFFAPEKAGGWLSPRRHWAETMFLWSLAFPVFGWLLMGLLRLTWEPGHVRQSFFQTGEAEDFEDLEFAPERVSEERRLWEATDIMPAADILLGRDPTLKRGAIETLARIRTPESIGWILQARTDPDPEVRFHATSTITKLKRDFESQLRATEQEVFENPTDAGRQVALERVRAEYAVSGLLDGRRRAELLGGCRNRLRALAQRQGPGALELLFVIDKDAAPDQALEHIHGLMRRDPAAAPRWRREEIQLLFKLGRHGEVTERLLQMRKDLSATPSSAETPEDLRWRALIFWWCDA
jgi:hypothetical protein